MNLHKFISLLNDKAFELEDDAEILIEDEDGWLHDFDLEDMEETFDGFYTATPAGLKLRMKKD